MSSNLAVSARSLAVFAMLAFAAPALAQQYGGEVDPEIRIQQLEERLRTLTGQNEELQYRNRRLEDQVRQLQSGAGVQPGGPGAAAPPGAPQQPPVYSQQPQSPGYGQGQQPQGQVYGQQPQAPIVQEQVTAPPATGRRRGDAFDPNQNPQAPGVPRALGGGQLPIPAEQGGNLPGRDPGAPIDLSNNAGRYPDAGAPQQQAPRAGVGAGLTTLPPSASPRDEFDLGIGYMQRRDYALAEETMRNFATKYPNDALTPDAQYWLGESFFQRQMYRDAAESFLAVTSKYDKSGKAPDALLRLGQSLSALKEKEAACAALGEIGRKYPKASAGVRRGVEAEQKKLKC
ncbi:tol-pal system protein YbgF [Rhodopseudomonas telluris]|uniref:Cell division coordinator CpoB n=1 Tax=Rhodopseudomonas telluris TaxID=644215 RepID=A0ABV6EVM2_9BRAD